MPKPSLKTSPYFLLYGKEAILPLNVYLQTFQLSQESWVKLFLMVQSRTDTILELQEERKKTKEKNCH